MSRWMTGLRELELTQSVILVPW